MASEEIRRSVGVVVEPGELLPEFGDLGGARGGVHAARGAVEAVREVHGPLGVGEAGGGAVGRRHVEVVEAHHQVHALALLGRFRRRDLAELVLEEAQNHVALEHRAAIRCEEGRHLAQRVDARELVRLQVRVLDHLRADRRFLFFVRERQPEPDARRVVGVLHVVERKDFGAVLVVGLQRRRSVVAEGFFLATEIVPVEEGEGADLDGLARGHFRGGRRQVEGRVVDETRAVAPEPSFVEAREDDALVLGHFRIIVPLVPRAMLQGVGLAGAPRKAELVGHAFSFRVDRSLVQKGHRALLDGVLRVDAAPDVDEREVRVQQGPLYLGLVAGGVVDVGAVAAHELLQPSRRSLGGVVRVHARHRRGGLRGVRRI
mmetsp:Transcript_21774/g.67088  ORF Transcript_21774/g.67088 Transcript_21774/m.67088 type:complete len:374 (-) Transcript_21774:419-1540(-)